MRPDFFARLQQLQEDLEALKLKSDGAERARIQAHIDAMTQVEISLRAVNQVLPVQEYL